MLVRAVSFQFPDPRHTDPRHPVAIGGALEPDMLLAAYAQGLFPWSVDPVTWWSPDPRGVLPLGGVKIPRSLKKFLKKTPFALTRDKAFDRVVAACARPGSGRESTWIAPEMARAYGRLHRLGHAHSVECWLGRELVGGLYGVCVGGLFSGESLFHTAPNAGKAALLALVAHLRGQGFTLLDTQMVTPVLAQLGAVNISREHYLLLLEEAVKIPVAFS